MYTLVLDEGIVIRESDGYIVAPCQSDTDPDFRTYIDWVMVEGNEPKVVDTRSNG
jgi:hypothetical protein